MTLVVITEWGMDVKMFHIRTSLCSEVSVCVTEKKFDSEEQSILFMNNNLCLQHEQKFIMSNAWPWHSAFSLRLTPWMWFWLQRQSTEAGSLFKSTHIQGDWGQALCIQQLTALHHPDFLNDCVNPGPAGLSLYIYTHTLTWWARGQHC